MAYYQRIVFHSGDRLADSSYNSPVFRGLSFSPQMDYADFYKVSCVAAHINANITTGDQSHLVLKIKGKNPINQTDATGTGSSASYHITMVPIEDKVNGGANAYTLKYPDRCKEYLLYNKHDWFDGNAEFEIWNGNETQLIVEPTSGDYKDWTFILAFEPIRREDLIPK